MTILQNMTAGAARVAETDPHGWTLTLISVSVVFFALVVLFCIYTLSGKAFTGGFKRRGKAPRKGRAGELAAAIATALSLENAGEVQAAIAVALELENGGSCHDIEPGFITIRKTRSGWDDRSRNFRKSINR